MMPAARHQRHVFPRPLRIAANMNQPRLRHEVQHLLCGGRIIGKYKQFGVMTDCSFEPAERLAVIGFAENAVEFGRPGVEVVAAADVHGDR